MRRVDGRKENRAGDEEREGDMVRTKKFMRPDLYRLYVT